MTTASLDSIENSLQIKTPSQCADLQGDLSDCNLFENKVCQKEQINHPIQCLAESQRITLYCEKMKRENDLRNIFKPAKLSWQRKSERKILIGLKTDKCTGWLDGTKKYDWSKCCIMHDLQMWAGGTKENRNLADKELKSCVKEASNGFHANLIYLGVSTGKLSPIKLKDKKWGHAWDKDFQKSALTIDDIKKIETELMRTDTPEVSIELKKKFIQKLIQTNIKAR